MTTQVWHSAAVKVKLDSISFRVPANPLKDFKKSENGRFKFKAVLSHEKSYFCQREWLCPVFLVYNPRPSHS